MKDSWIIAIFSVICVLVCGLLVMISADRVLHGINDFGPLYLGPQLAAEGELYNRSRLHDLETELWGSHVPSHGYIRPPFHAVLMWPLSQLPYRAAYVIWTVASLGALALFVWLWRPPGGQLNILFGAMCLPAFVAAANGQDINFFLVAVALAARWAPGDRPFAAGLVLSLCAAKFHLFALLPVALVAQRRWAALRGLLAGGFVLTVTSYLAAGWSWPSDFVASATNPAFTPKAAHPNLHGLFQTLNWPLPAEGLASVLVVLAVWLISRRRSFSFALASALVGGLMVSYHAYTYDAALLLPAALTVIACGRNKATRLVAAASASLPTYQALVVGGRASLIAVGAAVALVALMVFETVRQEPADAGQPGPARPAA